MSGMSLGVYMVIFLCKFVKRNKNQLRDYMTTEPARLAEIRAEIFPYYPGSMSQ